MQMLESTAVSTSMHMFYGFYTTVCRFLPVVVVVTQPMDSRGKH